MTDDVLARIDAALAEVDAAPLPDDTWWEAEAGKWTAEPSVDAPRLVTYPAPDLRVCAWSALALVAVTRSQDLCDFNEAARASYRERVLAPVMTPRRPGRAGQVSPYGPLGRTVRT